MNDLVSALGLPVRPGKPRTSGLTNVLDKGTGLRQLQDQLELVAPYVDIVKLGWGTSLVTVGLEEKLDVYKQHGVDVCFGGTLFELCYLRDQLDRFERWLEQLGVSVVEISDGTLQIDLDEKVRLIERFSTRFQVLSEVGSKDGNVIVSPARWVRAIRAELDAGASHVILEGRESGSAGLYRASGEIRMGLVDEIVESGLPVDRVIFEAPQKSQQAWLVTALGSNVNLANIPLTDVIAVETLRLGLRSDTMLHVHGEQG